MALQTLPGGVWLPSPWHIAAGAPNLTSVTLNASGDRVAFVFAVPKSGTLDWFEFRLQAVANNPDNGLRLSFQTVDTGTGDPDGIQDQFADLTGALSAGWQVPSVLTHDGTGGGVKRTVAAGELLGCVVDFVSFVASDSVSVAYSSSGVSALNTCYVADGSAGSYTKLGGYPVLALKYSDGTYACFDLPVWPLHVINTRTFNNGSSPDERGVRFTLPVTASCTGAWARLDVDGAADVVLYDSSHAELASVLVSTGPRLSTAGLPVFVYWPAVTLTANQVYRVAVRPASGTNLSMYDADVSTSALQACIPGGASWYSTSRTDAGAWTDTDTNRPWMGILLSQLDDGAGGGGGGLSWAPLSIVAAAGTSLVRAIASGSTSGRG